MTQQQSLCSLILAFAKEWQQLRIAASAGPALLTSMNGPQDLLLSAMAISAGVMLVAGRAFSYLSQSNLPDSYIVVQSSLSDEAELVKLRQAFDDLSASLDSAEEEYRIQQRQLNTLKNELYGGVSHCEHKMWSLEQKVKTVLCRLLSAFAGRNFTPDMCISCAHRS